MQSAAAMNPCETRHSHSQEWFNHPRDDFSLFIMTLKAYEIMIYI